jgi:hypothetical protein
MAIVVPGLAEEISSRVHRLQVRYSDNPLIKGIDYRIGVDWSDDPAVFIEVTLAAKEIPTSEVIGLAENLHIDLLRLVGTDEIGLHSYLNFVH